MNSIGSIGASYLICAAACVTTVFCMPAPECKSAEEPSVMQLIGQLASGNPAPEVVGKRNKTLVYPAHYDHEKENRVMLAIDELVNRGVVAFPELITSMNDSRYSYTNQGHSPAPRTVGEVCRSIIQLQVEVYSGFTRVEPGRGAFTFLPQGTGKMEEWWKTRHDRTLRELQLEAVVSTLDAVRQQSDVDADLKEMQIGGLERLLKRLLSSKDPICVDRNGYFVGDKELETFREVRRHSK